MSQKFCSKCGSPLQPDSKFCMSCGHSVSPNITEKPVNHSNNKWIFIGVAAVVAILALFMLNKNDSPEKIATKFVEHMSNFEYEKAKDLLARDADEYFKDEIDWIIDEIKDDPSVMDEQKEYAEEYGYKIESFKVTDVDEEEDYAFVYGDITYVNGETESIDIDLLKENKKWKVEDSY